MLTSTHSALITMPAILLAALLNSASKPVSPAEAEATARIFCESILAHDAFSYYEFEGEIRERFKSLLSDRLLAQLDNIHSCNRDWSSHQPANSTDKPPFVDCCVFPTPEDWTPTSFVIQDSASQRDGRRRVTVEYRVDPPSAHARMHFAVYVVREHGRCLVDDIEGGLDDGDSANSSLLHESPDCRNGKWVSGY